MIGIALAWFFAAGLFALGIATFPAPAAMSRLYGIPTDDPSGLAFVRATGLRDIALGGILVAFLVFPDPAAAAVTCAATGLCAAVDFALVVSRRGLAPVLQLGVHASGIAMGAAAAVALRMGV